MSRPNLTVLVELMFSFESALHENLTNTNTTKTLANRDERKKELEATQAYLNNVDCLTKR